MPDISLDLLGLGELEVDFQRLSRSLANKAVRDAVMAGAKLARDKTRQSAPVRSGKLKKNIVVTRQRGTPDAAVAGVSVKRPAGKKRQSPKPESAPYYVAFSGVRHLANERQALSPPCLGQQPAANRRRVAQQAGAGH